MIIYVGPPIPHLRGENMELTLLSELPEIVGKLSTYLRDASPAVLIVIGALLFMFAGMAKWIVRLVGAGLFIYGLLAVLHVI